MRKSEIPFLLLYIRLLLGIVIIPLSLLPASVFSLIAVVVLGIGVITDFFDGYIARRLGVSTENLRRLDSTVDVFFFLGISLATGLHCPDFVFREKAAPLLLLIGSEAATYGLSFIKFRKELATHSIGAKIWTLVLAATLVDLLLDCQSGVLFDWMLWLGLATRLEIAGILLVLRVWTPDVPSIWHAVQLRRGKTIRRLTIFNG